MKTPRSIPVFLFAALCAVLFPMGSTAQVEGYVDLHSHLMGEHSFGGSWFWGDLEGPINPAVVRCDGNAFGKTHAALRYSGLADLINGPLFGEESGDTGLHLGKRRGYDERSCRYIFGFAIPGTCPRPHFEGWPTWTSMAHQQMWQGWLQQAHQNGLRVMVVSLAESNFLCINTPWWQRRYDCDEMASVHRQALFVQGFVSRNSSWVGIARTAAEARALIGQGKLALVLAVEITRLFPSGDYIAQLDAWRNLGIRSVQVVHHADNRFAGAAQIPALKTAANLVEFIEGGIFETQDLTDIDDIVCRDSAGNEGDCDGDTYLNEKGLSLEGMSLVNAMMDRGMLLDVAHLSRKSFQDVYNLALPRGYPLLYSHVHTWDTIASDEKNEKFLRDDEIHMITDTGGMIGLRTGPEDTVQYTSPVQTPSQVANICQGSTRSFAQSLMYSVDNGLDVGFGADFNGFTRQMKPSHRSPACWTDYWQINASGGPNWFQSKGLGHVGLLPELMADLSRVGVPRPYIDHLNNSAETFLRLWARSESLAVTPSGNLARFATASASTTYCSGGGPGPHCYSPARANDGSRSTALGGLDSWVNEGYTPFPQWLELTWGNPVTGTRVDLYTTHGYPIRAYDVQYWDDSTSSWVQLAAESNNTAVYRTYTGLSFTTRRLRVLAHLGPAVQPGYVRINEIEVY